MFYLSKTLLFELLEDTVSSLLRYVFQGTCFYHFQPFFCIFLSGNVPKLGPEEGGANGGKTPKIHFCLQGVPLGLPGEPKATKMEPKGVKMTPRAPQNDITYAVLGSKMNAPNGTTPCHQKPLPVGL